MATSYTPPAKAIWWNEPIERTEVIWITIAFLWCLFMLGWMIAWHWIGNQNMANEAYKTNPDTYARKVEEFTAKYTVRMDANDPTLPVVRPPAGSDVYLAASRWQWRPLVELQKGASYRIHISSLDWDHGFSLQPLNINFQAYPGYEQVITMTPNSSGTFSIVCNEYCGIGHHTMLGKLYVKE